MKGLQEQFANLLHSYKQPDVLNLLVISVFAVLLEFVSRTTNDLEKYPKK